MKKLFLALFFFFSFSAHAACDDQFSAAGAPTLDNTTTIICRIGYAVHYVDACKAPGLVLEYLLPENIGGKEPRSSFRKDPDVSASAVDKDYLKSGFDRGHMAPAGDFTKNSAAMAQSFYLTNVVPQVAKFNRGAWKYLEIYVRALALKNNGIYVYTGVIFGQQKIGTGVCVPVQMYKVIIDPHSGDSVVYLMPNSASAKSYQNYIMTLEDLERLTNINFAPNNLAAVRIRKDKLGLLMIKPDKYPR